MFPKPLQKFTNLNVSTPVDKEVQCPYNITNKGYGKDAVKLLHVDRNGPVHTIQELEVGTHLKLTTNKEYVLGINSDVVDSDAMKNVVYLLAKKYGIEGPEKFALLVGNHFLATYAHVYEAHVRVEAYPWQRIRQGDSEDTGKGQQSQPHNHAFVFAPTAVHFCDIIVRRNDPKQTVISGIKKLRVLKTTKSSFVNFVDDVYRTTPDQFDRVFSVIAEGTWEYSCTKSVDFLKAWQTVRDALLKNFAGDPNVGVSSPCTQNTAYLSAKDALDAVPQIAVISITLTNMHYFTFDTKPFQQVAPGDNNEVFMPVEKPHSSVYAELSRKNL
ncbi:uricase [Drosophila grimshawi]|uniref:Uricase n=1 Tax=Drosophila grimshawi TaxID=7222 RepID=B4JEU8_DROGR|nr:uricase [Drosophila grimshawi]EDV93229.1 GH19189 [Drosophila grimshawi]